MSVTMIEVAKTSENPLRAGLIETLYRDEKIFQWWEYQEVQGDSFAYNKEHTLPSVAFRRINGTYASSTGVIQKDVEVLKPFGGYSDVDRQIVNIHGQEKRRMYDEMYIKAMGVHYAQWAIYGHVGARVAGFTDVDGFDGIITRLADPGPQVIDGGGTTGTDGSSVIAIKFGDGNTTGLQTPAGLEIDNLGEREAAPQYRTRIEQMAGLAIEHGASVAWIKDLTAAATLTYGMMDQLVDAIDGDPTVILMTKRSRRQLKASCLGAGIIMQDTLDRLGRPILAWDTVPIVTSKILLDTENVP